MKMLYVWTVDISRYPAAHRLVVAALLGVSVAVAGLALELVIRRVAPPLLLGEPVLALLAVDALVDNVKWQVHISTLLCISAECYLSQCLYLSPVLALALQHLAVGGGRADVGVAVTHAPVDIIDIE